jgi:eukaryotic-like serine/threonine-protein kinase
MTALGRYELFDVLASGGMASVYLGRLRGDDAFARVVAIKRLHAQFAGDPEFSGMLRDEARLASRIRHPNVVSVIDVVAEGATLSLVMDYVPGESLARLARAGRVPPAIASSVMLGVLAGLHAAHEAADEDGRRLDLVHRDVSPHNVLVGTDGLAHVIDFGIAKARGRSSMTREGDLKGKLAYMAPEQLRRATVSHLVDVYAAAATLWELLAGRRMFEADDEAGLIVQVLSGASEPPSRFAGDVSKELDAIVMRGLAREPTRRYPTARAMAEALEQALPPASHAEVAAWLEAVAHDALLARSHAMAAAERGEGAHLAPPEPEAATTTYRGRRSPLRLALVGLGLLVVCGGIGGAFAFARAGARLAKPAPSESAVADSPPASVAAPADDPPLAGSASAGPRQGPPVSPVRPPSRPRTRPPRPDCDPNYTIENGHKVFKRACL